MRVELDRVRDNNMRNVTSSSYGLLKGTGKTKGVADISGE